MRERAAILLASSVGTPVPQIAAMWMTDESHVRKVIQDFNDRGMASLDPDYWGGRPRRITERAAPPGRCGGRCLPRHSGERVRRLPSSARHIVPSARRGAAPDRRALASASLPWCFFRLPARLKFHARVTFRGTAKGAVFGSTW
jgi:hypothetical protein